MPQKATFFRKQQTNHRNRKEKNMDFLQITKIVGLEDGFYAVEILNKNDDTYNYYLYKENFALSFSFGVMTKDRCSDESLQNLYNNGYFDGIIETQFI